MSRIDCSLTNQQQMQGATARQSTRLYLSTTPFQSFPKQNPTSLQPKYYVFPETSEKKLTHCS